MRRETILLKGNDREKVHLWWILRYLYDSILLELILLSYYETFFTDGQEYVMFTLYMTSSTVTQCLYN